MIFFPSLKSLSKIGILFRIQLYGEKVYEDFQLKNYGNHIVKSNSHSLILNLWVCMNQNQFGRLGKKTA